MDDPIEEKPLLRSENPLVSALEVFDAGPDPAALAPLLAESRPPPTERKLFVKAEVDLEKAESKTLPDLLVSSLAESRGFVTAVVKVRFDRAEMRGCRRRNIWGRRKIKREGN